MTADARDPFVKGQRIDRYEIREHVGQGGMGAVYRALDTKLGRTLALKTVAAHQRGDNLTEEIRERFMREALAASRVEHRNVVQVMDFGFAEDGTPYMVMEFLRGRSLGDLLRSAKQPLPIDGVVDIMLSVCAALRACHRVGIIHRDLKPANIFLCDTDTGWEVKVLDFGISKAPATDDLTQDGRIIGTPQYLSPEQIEGTVGPESDQYALGVVLYLCLTGRLPFGSHRGGALLRAISGGQFEAPRTVRPDLPAELDDIVRRAMHASRAQRFESIHTLGQRLWGFASPRSQAQWKAFYREAPAAAGPVEPTTGSNASTSADEAPLRDTKETRRIESTATLAVLSSAAQTRATSQPAVGAGADAATKTAAPPGAGDTTSPSHSDIVGESAVTDARAAIDRPGSRLGARVRLAIVLAGVTAGAIAGIHRASQRHRPRPSVASGVIAAPAAREAPAVSLAPAARGPAPAPAAPLPPPAPTAAGEPPAPRRPASKKHATHHRRRPNTDQHGIGIPTD